MKPEIVGYACAVLNSKEFYKKQEVAWIPEMCTKYPEQLTERHDLSQAAKVGGGGEILRVLLRFRRE